MGIFVIGNALCALAPSYSLLMGARIVTAFSHGAFFGLGSVVAAEIVPPEKKARAIALMFTGLALANVLGVPFGTALGQALGWRTTFWAVVGIGIIAVTALYTSLPRSAAPRAVGFMQEALTLGRAQVLLAMLMSVFASASLFSVFTYITPMLEQVTRETPHQVTLVLLLLGLGLTVGNTIGGQLGDWRLMPAVIGTFTVLVVALTCLAIADHSPRMTAATIFVWGALAFALISPLQMRVVNEASAAPNLAATLNQGAFNLGNAAGAFAGELALTHGLPYGNIPFLGAAFAAIGLALSVFAFWLDRRADASRRLPIESRAQLADGAVS
jgi:DHA1 family inner membrane transport protein